MNEWQREFFLEHMRNGEEDIRLVPCTVSGEETYSVMMNMAEDKDHVWAKDILVFVTPGMVIERVSGHKVTCDNCDAPKEVDNEI